MHSLQSGVLRVPITLLGLCSGLCRGCTRDTHTETMPALWHSGDCVVFIRHCALLSRSPCHASTDICLPPPSSPISRPGRLAGFAPGLGRRHHLLLHQYLGHAQGSSPCLHQQEGLPVGMLEQRECGPRDVGLGCGAGLLILLVVTVYTSLLRTAVRS